MRWSRQRLELSDGDFIDLDWYESGSRRVVLLAHGLEGSSRGSYVKGMARAFHRAAWDVAAFNFRGCSGEPNRTLRFYHGGATADLHEAVEAVVRTGRYTGIVLAGFSLGGNLVLKYLGDGGFPVDPLVKAAVGISVPVDLSSSARELEKPHNRVYSRRFLLKLRTKVRAMMKRYPDKISDRGFGKLKTLGDFDNAYTAPLHGFRDASDYWSRCSAKQFLPSITVPTLLIQSEDDPLLGPGCFPVVEAEENEHLCLLMPRYGGHVGFVELSHDGLYWDERKAVDFACQWAPSDHR